MYSFLTKLIKFQQKFDRVGSDEGVYKRDLLPLIEGTIINV